MRIEKAGEHVGAIVTEVWPGGPAKGEEVRVTYRDELLGTEYGRRWQVSWGPREYWLDLAAPHDGGERWFDSQEAAEQHVTFKKQPTNCGLGPLPALPACHAPCNPCSCALCLPRGCGGRQFPDLCSSARMGVSLGFSREFDQLWQRSISRKHFFSCEKKSRQSVPPHVQLRAKLVQPGAGGRALVGEWGIEKAGK